MVVVHRIAWPVAHNQAMKETSKGQAGCKKKSAEDEAQAKDINSKDCDE